jgi:hypothetical protein
MFDSTVDDEPLAPIIPKDCLGDLDSIKQLIDEWFPDNKLSEILSNTNVAAYLAQDIYINKLGIPRAELDENFLKKTIFYSLKTMRLIFDDAESQDQLNKLEAYGVPISLDENEVEELLEEYVKVRTPRTESLLAKAKQIYYAGNQHLDRHELMEKFITMLGMNPKSASTYYYLVKK